MRLSIKLGLLSGFLTLSAAGMTSVFLVQRAEEQRSVEFAGRDRELAAMLASQRVTTGAAAFDALSSFVEAADRADLGLVYALDLEPSGKLRHGALNPRLFAAIAPRYEHLVHQGRNRVLEQLAHDHIDREGLIKEYSTALADGTLRLGFDLTRAHRQLTELYLGAVLLLAGGAFVGVLMTLLVSGRIARRLRLLRAAIDAAARGELDYTVNIPTHDEIGALAQAFNRMLVALRRFRHLERLWETYLPLAVARRLLREEDPLKLPIEERAVTVLTIELQSDGGAVGPTNPRGMLLLANRYLDPIIDAIHACGGTVLSLSARQLQAVWGAPQDSIESELDAVRAAVMARDEVRNEARRQALAGIPVWQLTAGIAMGRVAVGNLGSALRATYAVIGEAVELSQTIAAIAALDEILITEGVYNKVAVAVQAQRCQPTHAQGTLATMALYRLEGVSRPE